MRKRVLQVRMVKAEEPKNDISDSVKSHFKDATVAIGDVVERVLKTAGTIAIGYIVLDTARQIIVTKATKTQ